LSHKKFNLGFPLCSESDAYSSASYCAVVSRQFLQPVSRGFIPSVSPPEVVQFYITVHISNCHSTLGCWPSSVKPSTASQS